MARPTANLRLFVAAYPPPDIARAMLEALRDVGARLPEYRETPAEQVHMTLQFIGDTPNGELEATQESVRRSAAGIRPVVLTPLRLMTLPERGPARLVALETDAPPWLLEMHRRLAHRLAHNLREKSGDRFRPHFTLCRFGSPRAGVGLDESVNVPTFSIDRIRLMRSTLSPDGAQHHEIMACALEG